LACLPFANSVRERADAADDTAAAFAFPLRWFASRSHVGKSLNRNQSIFCASHEEPSRSAARAIRNSPRERDPSQRRRATHRNLLPRPRFKPRRFLDPGHEIQSDLLFPNDELDIVRDPFRAFRFDVGRVELRRRKIRRQVKAGLFEDLLPIMDARLIRVVSKARRSPPAVRGRRAPLGLRTWPLALPC
jgi:hypothetical protein